MAQLLTVGKIQSAGGGATLMNVSKHEITSLVPPKSRFIKVSKHGHLVDDLAKFIQTQLHRDDISGDQRAREPYVFVIPTNEDDSVDKVNEEYEEQIALSNYDLSSICTASKVCFAFEEVWNVLWVDNTPFN